MAHAAVILISHVGIFAVVLWRSPSRKFLHSVSLFRCYSATSVWWRSIVLLYSLQIFHSVFSMRQGGGQNLLCLCISHQHCLPPEKMKLGGWYVAIILECGELQNNHVLQGLPLGLCLQVILIVEVRRWIVWYRHTHTHSVPSILNYTALWYVPGTLTGVYAFIPSGLVECIGRKI